MEEEVKKSDESAASQELPVPEGFEPGLPTAEPETERESELQKDYEALQDKYMRTLAEVENFKKRVARERVEERAYAAQEVLVSLLPVLDNLERALQAAKAAGAAEGPAVQLQKGVELVVKQMEELLRKQGVTPVECELGAVFDPNLHQPLLQEPVEGQPEGAVLEILQKGYRLGDRLLRPVLVKVVGAA
jgi:molecular chaperone GrpE